MTLVRTVTIATANLGRDVPIDEFKRNVDKIKRSLSNTHTFIGFQEIDEADTPDEHSYLRQVFGETHSFAGWKTHCPIAVPKTFTIKRRIITHASAGVDHLSPSRQVVQAIVHPDGHPDCKVVPTNTHFARSAPQLFQTRIDSDQVLRERLAIDLPSWLTADLNSQMYSRLGKNEIKLKEARLDYIRAYERAGVNFKLLKSGTVDLTIDGHNAHWARVRITWPQA